MTALILEEWPLTKFKPYERNPRDNDGAVDRMVKAIKEYGFRIPIVAKSDGLIVDGHLRYKAAMKLGLKTVPVALADDLTDAQIKAFRLLANQSANWASWDVEKLSLEITDLKLAGLDLTLTGFEPGELSDILAAPQDFEFPAPPNSVAVNQDRMRNLREQRNRGKTNVISKGDTEHYIVLVYASRELREAALAHLGLPKDERYVLASAVTLTKRLVKGQATPAAADRSTKAAPSNKAGAVG